MFSMAASQSQGETRVWSDLPIDILYIILSLLPYQCYPHFASVCKAWRSCTFPVYPADRFPLLAHFRKWGDGICRYYSPLSNKTFIVDCPLDLSGNVALFYARHGWLLLYSRSEITLFNPTTNALHKSPNLLHVMLGAHGIAFLGNPPNQCIVFAINSRRERDVDIFVWKCGEDSYSFTEHNNNLPFVMSRSSNPVPLHGLFYCLGREGNLGVYDPNNDTWTVLSEPKQFKVSYKESFLVESDGELLAVVVGKRDRPLHIFKLNRTSLAWFAVKSIGTTRTLFGGSGMPPDDDDNSERNGKQSLLPKISRKARDYYY